MRIVLLNLLFLCFVNFLEAQQTLPAFNYIPQGPIAATFTRYGEIPVDLSTGVTSTSIPIYTLSENGINIPISISYHASGNKVEDIASTVGLGWTLNAGGGLTRTILGKKDEDVDRGYHQRSPWVTWQEFLDTADARETRNQRGWLNELHNYYLQNSLDYYSDRFYFNLGNGESGVFRKDFATGQYKTLPYKPMKIRFIQATASNNLKLEMTTVDGTRYIFNYNFHLFSDYWNAEKIINSAGTDSVMIYSHDDYINTYGYTSFQEFGSYGHTPMQHTEPFIESSPEGPCFNSMYIKQKYYHGGIDYTNSNHDEKVPIIDSIVGTNTTIRFTYAHDREEIVFWDSGNRLTNIQIYSKPANKLIKNFDFTHTYLGTGTEKRLLLAGIQTGVNGEDKHEFKYNPEPLPPYHTGPHAPSFQQDLWGYKNGSNNTSLLFADFAPGGTNNLFPNEVMAQAGILQEIKYPTGGKTIFQYESNRVPRGFYGPGFSTSLVPADGKVGGLRIKKISSYAHEGAVPEIKSYEYVCELDTAHGQLDFDNFAYNKETWHYYRPWVDGCGLTFAYYTGTSSKNICVSTPMGEYIGGPQAPVYYTVVTEYNGDANKNLGKTVYFYQRADMNRQDDSPPYFPMEPHFRSTWHYDAGSYLPPLLKKEEYKNVNGQFVLVRKTENAYTAIEYASFITGLSLASTLIIDDMSPTTFDPHRAFNTYLDEPSAPYYFTSIRYSNDFAYPGLEVPYKVDVYDYIDGNNYVKTSSEYTYNHYGRQTGVTTKTSKGEILKTKLTYPNNYPNQAPYNTMVERNILSPVIEQATYKLIGGNESLMQSMKTNYNYWNYATQNWGGAVSNQILPQNVETKKGTNDAETRIRYYSYDQKGNPVYVAKENDTRQLYLWDYNKTYPVAQVMNVSEDDKRYVVYSSFEAVTSWPIGGGIIVDDNTAPTGKKCLSLFGVNNLQYSLNSSQSYILSYWYKAGSSINVAANTAILTNPPAKNGWVLMKQKISGSSGVVISGSGYIDEVRLYPESAQMITFTYEPLVGMIAQCDVNDRITYYSYDASGRLSLVKDDNGNILKKVDYHFQSSSDGLGPNLLPQWELTGATRCKPCAQNPVYWTNITQLEERDNNVNSETYGNTRFRDTGEIGGPGRCYILGDWQLTGNLRCRTVGGQLTGEQERERKDMNPCSSTFGNTVWEVFTTNTIACPVPAVFQSLDVSGNYYKQNCTSPQLPKPYHVSMPQGAYTSSVDIQDATNKAKAEAQRLANLHGECVTVYVRMVKTLVSDPADYQQYTDNTFYFYADAAGTIPMSLPHNIPIYFRFHAYWTENGVFSSDEVISNSSTYGNGGYNTAVHQVESTFCPYENYCRHEEITLLPGPYVIIP